MRTFLVLALIGLALCSQFDIRSQSRCTDFAQGFCTRWEQNGTVEEMMAGCFPASARVYTPRGLTPMAELKRGEQVLALVDGKEQWTTVTGWFHNDPQQYDYLKLNLKQGWVEVSAKHSIAVSISDYVFADEATQLLSLGAISSVQKTKAKGLYAPKTASYNYFVHIQGSEQGKMLAHNFAHLRNPTLYEPAVSVIEATWDLLDPSASRQLIHPSFPWMQAHFSFLLE